MLKACERYDGGTKGLLVSIEHYQNTEQQKQQLVRAKSVSGASCCLVEGGLGGLSSTHIISSALTLSTSCLSAPYQSVTTEEQLLAGTGLVPGHLSAAYFEEWNKLNFQMHHQKINCFCHFYSMLNWKYAVAFIILFGLNIKYLYLNILCWFNSLHNYSVSTKICQYR